MSQTPQSCTHLNGDGDRDGWCCARGSDALPQGAAMACERNRLSSNRFRRNKCVQFNIVCAAVVAVHPLLPVQYIGFISVAVFFLNKSSQTNSYCPEGGRSIYIFMKVLKCSRIFCFKYKSSNNERILIERQ